MNNKRFSIVLASVLLAAVIAFLAFKAYTQSNAKALTGTAVNYLTLRQAKEYLTSQEAIQLPSSASANSDNSLLLRQEWDYVHSSNAYLVQRQEWEYVRSSDH
jgi:hypothetical protein